MTKILLTLLFGLGVMLSIFMPTVIAQSRNDRIKAQAFFETGNSLIEKGDFQNAIENFNESISLFSDHYLAFMNRGIAYLSLSKLDEAFADAERAHDIMKKIGSTNITHAALILQIKGTVKQYQGKNSEAIEYFTSAIELAPKEPNFLNSRGVIHQLNGNHEAALKDYLKAAEAAPKNVLIRTNVGTALFRLDKLDEALEELENALKIDNNFETAHYAKANVFSAKKNYEAALESYNKAISLKPKAEFFHARARIYYINKDLEKAINDYTKSIELNPRYSVAYSDRALMHSLSGNQKAAIQDIRQAILISGETAILNYSLGYFLYMNGQFSEALPVFNKVIQSESNWKAAYNLRSNINIKLGNQVQARSDREMAAKIKDSGSPPNAPLIFNLTIQIPEIDDN